MPNRREQIQLLIASQFDQLWFPSGSLKTQAGLAPGERVPCLDCGGSLIRDDFGHKLVNRKGAGFVTDRFKALQPCVTCGGRRDEDGKLIPGSGWVERDRMDRTRQVIGSEGTQASSRPRRTVSCDACAGEGATARGRCVRCDGSGRRDLHVFDLALDAGERAERWKGMDPDTLLVVDENGRLTSRRDQQGSYHELERALADLARASYSARRLVDQVYAFQVVAEQSLTTLAREKLEYGMRYLDLRMPSEIKVPTDVLANQRIRRNHRTVAKGKGQALSLRNQEIRQLAEQGARPQEIASQYGLNVSTVYEIVNKRSEAA